MSLRHVLIGILLVAVCGCRSKAGTASLGQQIFAEKCAYCHNIGSGHHIGPDLANVTQRRSHEWLVAWISDPSAIIASGDPIAVQLKSQFKLDMPNSKVTPDRTRDLIAFLALNKPPPPAPISPELREQMKESAPKQECLVRHPFMRRP